MMSPNYIMVLIQRHYINCIIRKNMKHYPLILLFIFNYINKINNRLVFKIKHRYKLELKTPETMKLFGSTKKLIDKKRSGEKVPSLEVTGVVSV